MTRTLLRDFVYLLKDLGLSAATIRRERVRHPDLLRLPGRRGKGAARSQRPAGDAPARAGAARHADRARRWRRSSPRRTSTSRSPGGTARCWSWRYGAGLRVSELCGLGITDLLLTENLVRVFGKGGKERLVPIGRNVIGAVSVYLHQLRPELDRGTERRPGAAQRARASRSRESAPGASSSARPSAPGSASGSRRTPCGTASRPTCSKAAPICARCRRCWATPISPPRRSTPTSIGNTSDRSTSSSIPAR